MNAVTISALAIAGVLLLAVVAFVVYVLFPKKRRKRSHVISDEIRTLDQYINSRLQRGKLISKSEEYETLYKSMRNMRLQLELQRSIEDYLPSET